MARKIATVTSTALMFSHALAPPLPGARAGALPLRRAATLERSLVRSLERSDAGFFEATGGADGVTENGRSWSGGKSKGAHPGGTRPFKHTAKTGEGYFRCADTSLVMSNMLTVFLPPKTALSLSSALMLRLLVLSWSPFFLM